jgi:nitrogen fixation/metabolism regulation signal transduction histidine kinase
MSWTRFERKILAAIVVAAVMPLLGALVLGRAVLREAYQVGVNTRVREQLERGLNVYRDHFVALRTNAGEVATAIGEDWVVRQALASADNAALQRRLPLLMTRYSQVARIVVHDALGNTLATTQEPSRLGEGTRLLDITQPLPDLATAVTLDVTVAAPSRPFDDYQRAGELAVVYRQLEKGKGQVAGFYLAVYMGFLLSVIVIALAVGIVISRRVTRRISLLADATRRVGGGDLEVQVPTDLRDEIGELTRDFNEMVRDIRESRGRIEYLQRIGAWQEFARRLAHEIKNPLTPIQLAIQEVHRSYPGDDATFKRRLQDARDIIEEEVATLRRLTSEFSTFAKLPEATLQPADLNDFLRDSSRSLQAVVDELRDDNTSLQLCCEASGGSLPVRIDAMMLKRALDNLVRNAAQALREHPPSGGTERMIVVRTSRVAADAILEVLDNGPGVAARDRQRVFDPYFTTKSEGTGLGLPIVKKVVLEHDGEISCSESDWGGAAFRIRLPLSSA